MDSIFNLKDIQNSSKTKEEMWNELDGKTVKCITVKDEYIQVFGVEDIENNKLYVLDKIIK